MIKPSFTVYLFLCCAVGILLSCSSTGNKNNRPAKSNTVLVNPSIPPPNPYVAVDISPMDVSYYPVNYPQQQMDGNDSAALAIRLMYSRPQKNGRIIFGGTNALQPYGKYWRLGANESSEIEFFKPVTIGNKKIDKGRYVIYCFPNAEEWTIKLNSSLFTWGLHRPDSTKDIASIDIPVSKAERSSEYLTMLFQKSATGADLLMTWDTVKAVLPITFPK
ncbi:MAG: DUF2911 domain-containing protein [Bacteroidetes bacterium]|nr:DUF2911 domain-containing protein [Bacteroidota bacterium]